MFGTLNDFKNQLTGDIEVSVENGIITVSGISSHQLMTTMQKVWKESRLKYLFIESTMRRVRFSFYDFYLIEFVYIIERLQTTRYCRINNRVLSLLLQKLKNIPQYRSFFNEYGIKPTSVDIERGVKGLDFDRLSDMGSPPRSHQMEYMKKYDENVRRYQLNGHLANVDVGGGKTYLSLCIMHLAHVDTVIAITLSSAVKNVWRENFEWVFKKKPDYWDSNMNVPPTPDKSHYVIHMDLLGIEDKKHRFADFIRKNADYLTRYDPKLGRHRRVGFIIDECHNFNNNKSNRTNTLLDLIKVCKSTHVFWMSGTPFKKSGSEVYPMLTTLDPLFTRRPEVGKSFLALFGQARERALDIIAHRLNIISYRVDSKAYMNEGEKHEYRVDVKLPNAEEYTLPVIREKLKAFVKERTEYYNHHGKFYEQDYRNCIAYYKKTIELDKTAQQAFSIYELEVESIRRGYDPILHKEITPSVNKFEKNHILPNLPNDMKHKFRKAKSIYKYPQLTILGEALGMVLGKTRTKCNIDIALNLDKVVIKNSKGLIMPATSIYEVINGSEKKSIMFSSFVDVIKAVENDLKDKNYRPIIVYGDTNKDLVNMIKQFDKDPDINPLIATYQSLSTAVPLTMANTIILMNSPYRDIERKQAIGRAYRIGQDKPVYIYDVFLDTGSQMNISTRSKDIMDMASEQVAIMMGLSKVDLTVSVESLDEYNKDVYNGAYDRYKGILKVALEDYDYEDDDRYHDVVIQPSLETYDPLKGW